MEPPAQTTPFPALTGRHLHTIEAEEHVTKEVDFHIVRSPQGEPLSYHRLLGHAIDFLSERGETAALLVAQEWAVVLLFDPDGTIAAHLGGTDHG